MLFCEGRSIPNRFSNLANIDTVRDLLFIFVFYVILVSFGHIVPIYV